MIEELLQCHCISELPACSTPKSAYLAVDESAVLADLKGFPQGTSLGGSGLFAQHLLNAVVKKSYSPNKLLLSGKAFPLLAT